MWSPSLSPTINTKPSSFKYSAKSVLKFPSSRRQYVLLSSASCSQSSARPNMVKIVDYYLSFQFFPFEIRYVHMHTLHFWSFWFFTCICCISWARLSFFFGRWLMIFSSFFNLFLVIWSYELYVKLSLLKLDLFLFRKCLNSKLFYEGIDPVYYGFCFDFLF